MRAGCQTGWVALHPPVRRPAIHFRGLWTQPVGGPGVFALQPRLAMHPPPRPARRTPFLHDDGYLIAASGRTWDNPFHARPLAPDRPSPGRLRAGPGPVGRAVRREDQARRPRPLVVPPGPPGGRPA